MKIKEAFNYTLYGSFRTSLAEAHARLALRTEVLFEDVATIIYLYEEALSSFFGESLTPFQNSPRDHEQPIYIWVHFFC